MNPLTGEFTARRTFDRYIEFLGSLPSTFNNIESVFERRRQAGHQLATLAADSRLNDAAFHERYLRGLWQQTNDIKLLCGTYVDDLLIFTRECQDITLRTSRSEPLHRVDFRWYSLANASTWKLFPPENVSDLVHELHLRFRELCSAIRQLKYVLTEVHGETYGLASVFASAMNHRSCKCHTQPAVAEELFRDARTTPAWDITYSSSNASIRAAEYRSEIESLFKAFVVVNSHMGFHTEAVYQHAEEATLELVRATYVATLGQLNFRLGMMTPCANQCRLMLNDLEQFLRR